MSEIEKQVQKYLTPTLNSFWRWDDEGEVIVWADGSTILFRQELAEIAAHLAPLGLPPLEILLILIAIMRDRIENIKILKQRFNSFKVLRSILLHESQKSNEEESISNLERRFQKIQKIPRELRSSLQGKAIIAEVVFENYPNRTSPKTAHAILGILSSGLEEIHFQTDSDLDFPPNSYDLTLKDIASFLKGIDQLDPQKLPLRQSTGLDELPQPVELELPFAQQIRQLISELKHEEEHQILAKLAQNLLAAVSLPRPVSEPEDITHGGVSDICNRGPLDRLLLSELANDDLTLTVRVAVNEALYLRREASPHPPNRCRTLLIDCGIRTWGIPRVYLAAVALALAATVDPQNEFQAFRAIQNELEPVDLTSREGLEELLQTLDTYLHPAFALSEFIRQLQQTDFDPEPVLITTEDVWRDPELQYAIQESEIDTLHIATVKRDGQFQLLEKNSRGIKTLCKLHLDLEEIFSNSPKSVSAITKETGIEHLPAIFSMRPFPLRLAYGFHQGKRTTWWVPGYGQLGVTYSGLLLFWSNSRFGASLLAYDIPHLKGDWIQWKTGLPEEGRVSLVTGKLQNSELEIVHIDLEKQDVSHTSLELEQMKCTAICAHQGFLFCINDSFHTIVTVDAITGERAGSCHYPSNLEYVCDRFFRNTNRSKWFALSHDMVKGEPILTEFALGEISPREVVTIFERDPDTGPVCILRKNGTIYFPAREQTKVIPLMDSITVDSLAPEHISADGQIVVLKVHRSYKWEYCLLNLYSMQAELKTDFRDIQSWVDQPAHWKKTVVNVRKKFLGIIITSDGKLVLKSNKQIYLRLDYNQSQNKIELAHHKLSALDETRLKTFKPVKTDRNVGCQLSVATWDDGSQAFLDSRGMLHLQSSDLSITEVTLVLVEKFVSGWCADNRFWGDPYFCGEHDLCDPKEIFDSVIQEFVEHLS
ncbi:hypothetical protein Pan241w_17450 [Gimesia alba]|uniref:Uncharacterized protein n=1 Tax=Gimesia alba TaxID=2527973 RepID=A0A517RCS4_9PLAN|nr:hypothetical protein [Gimesia alba]QDT41682.1 hypothetical protein Pan241w_17450 [Gimesia alba]